MTSRKEYYASRDASKVYQNVSILLFSSMESVPFLRYPMIYLQYIPKLLLNVCKKRIQEELGIALNIVAMHPLSLRMLQ